MRLIKKHLTNFILVLLVGLGVALPLASPALASSLDANKALVCQGIGTTGGNCTDGTGTSNLNSLITNVINLLSVVVGIVAIVMLIISGLKFITSGGEANAVASAKKGVIFSLVGLVVVGLAQFIVHFVLGHVAGVGSGASIILSIPF